MFALVWKKQTRLAAMLSPLAGMAAGLAVWVTTAQHMYGNASITSLGKTFPCMYASIASAFVPLPLCLAISYAWPDRNFEWDQLLKKIERVEDNEHGTLSAKASRFSYEAYYTPERSAHMKRMARLALGVGIFTFLCQWVLWPLPVYGARFIFSEGLFAAQVVIALIWLFVASFIASFYPLVDGGWRTMRRVFSNKSMDEGQADGNETPVSDQEHAEKLTVAEEKTVGVGH
jgi:urea-proton symporter